jgi:hypothetical protein
VRLEVILLGVSWFKRKFRVASDTRSFTYDEFDWLSTQGEPAHLRLDRENLRRAQTTTVTSPGNLWSGQYLKIAHCSSSAVFSLLVGFALARDGSSAAQSIVPAQRQPLKAFRLSN